MPRCDGGISFLEWLPLTARYSFFDSLQLFSNFRPWLGILKTIRGDKPHLRVGKFAQYFLIDIEANFQSFKYLSKVLERRLGLLDDAGALPQPLTIIFAVGDCQLLVESAQLVVRHAWPHVMDGMITVIMRMDNKALKEP